MKAKVLGAALGAVVCAATLAGCGSSSGLSSTSALQVLGVTTAAANLKGSARLESNETIGGTSETSVYDISGSEGRQTITGLAGTSLLYVVAQVAYQKSDARFLESSEGFSASAATAAAGRWISFRPGDTDYQAITSGDTLTSALSEATPTGALKLLKPSTVDGQVVVGVSGGLPADEAGVTGSQVLYVAQNAPYLPVELVVHETQGKQSATGTIIFSRWAVPVSVTAPQGSIPISSLSAKGT
jgi:hypothetical protein